MDQENSRPADRQDGAIAVSSLRFSYPGGEFSLDIPRLVVPAGERLAVIGPSGCGKTTLLNLMAGILVPDSGRIVVGGETVSALSDPDRRRFRIARLGLVFQSFALVEYLNVLDNIVHCYRVSSALRLDTAIVERATSLAQGLGLGDKLRRPVGALSQGERQRVAICRAVLSEPELLMADEATGNLDPANKGRILDLLFERLEPGRSTLIAVTHDHDLLDRFDRVVDYRDLATS